MAALSPSSPKPAAPLAYAYARVSRGKGNQSPSRMQSFPLRCTPG